MPRFCVPVSLRSTAHLVLLLAPIPQWGQPPDWHAGVAKVTTKPDLGRRPGAAFVVAISGARAYLVTSAHVVEGDPNPQVEFVIDTGKPYRAAVTHQEAGEERGLALLVIENPRAGVKVLLESGLPLPGSGTKVDAAGFPAPFGAFGVVDTTITARQGRDVILSRETGEGFSGGPVLRDGAVVGLVYGRDAGFGKALGAASVREYLEGHNLSWERALAEKPKEDAPSEVNISGAWIDNWGNTAQITQAAGTFRLTARGNACLGYFQSSGSGTIKGLSFQSTYQSNYSRGKCSGTISPDGLRITSNCNDSVCGEFSSSSVRQ